MVPKSDSLANRSNTELSIVNPEQKQQQKTQTK